MHAVGEQKMAGREQLRVTTNLILKEEGHPTLTSEQVDAVFKGIVKLLSDGDRVQVQHFGTFFRKMSLPRTSHNPQNPAVKIEVPGKVKMGLQVMLPPFEMTSEEKTKMALQEEIMKNQKAGTPAKPAEAKKPAPAKKAEAKKPAEAKKAEPAAEAKPAE